MKLNFICIGIAFIGLSSFSIIDLNKRYTGKSTETIRVYQNSDGLKLIEKSDCLTCHNKDKKVVGPSYIDIANKYQSNSKNISLLADKVINGGTDVWGKIPMTPHLSLKKDEAKKMVSYILSLKTK
jgi:cytochrome c